MRVRLCGWGLLSRNTTFGVADHEVFHIPKVQNWVVGVAVLRSSVSRSGSREIGRESEILQT